MLGFTIRPRCLVHDLIFEQRIADPHGDRTGDLAFGGLQVYDETHVLDRDDLVDLHDAGLDVHGDFGHLNAADALVGEVVAAADALAGRDDRGDSQLCARLFPGQTLGGISLDLDLAARRLQVGRIGAEGRGHFLEEQVQGVHGCAPG